ncbi:UNVERIFIED_CONTAM: hypothetical protein FKN15_013492 [Acipenser sinensis]
MVGAEAAVGAAILTWGRTSWLSPIIAISCAALDNWLRGGSALIVGVGLGTI